MSDAGAGAGGRRRLAEVRPTSVRSSVPELLLLLRPSEKPRTLHSRRADRPKRGRAAAER